MPQLVVSLQMPQLVCYAVLTPRKILTIYGGCHWARWLLLSRLKGHEYEASFANACAVSPSFMHKDNLTSLYENEVTYNIDTMAGEMGELVALATLMYASFPMQKCLVRGRINKRCNSSFLCTLETLKPGLQKFPTLQSVLISACREQDTVLGISDYLKWRDQIFSSAEGDTSLSQILPCWMPLSVRRMIKVFTQGPSGDQSSTGTKMGGESPPFVRSDYFVGTNKNVLYDSVSWEDFIEGSIDEELNYSHEEDKISIEHHLQRGQALGVFNYLLTVRAQRCESSHGLQQISQARVLADVQTILEPLTKDEGLFFSSVIPLGILNFHNAGFVAGCAFLLELLGVSSSMLHIDISALQRISLYYKTRRSRAYFGQVEPVDNIFQSLLPEDSHIAPMAKALADNYQKVIDNSAVGQRDSIEFSNQPSGILIYVLHDLEKASLPFRNEFKSCGSWLKNGSGKGIEFRSQQKADSKHWSVVTEFCQMHGLPLSTKYLTFLAKDNDWVGFLTEAQQGGFPIDTVIQTAAEFGDLRLRRHILTVLRNMESIKRRNESLTTPSTQIFSEMTSVGSGDATPSGLFALLSDCEKQKNPGDVLLQKAKGLQWPFLAMIASCFPGVSPLSCLKVWLEITAMRETSSVKVDDIYSQISRNISAAVKSTNELLESNEAIGFNYDRRKPKRRRYLHSSSLDHSFVHPSDMPHPSMAPKVQVMEVNPEGDGRENSPNMAADFETLRSLSKMVAVLCEQQLYLPLLRAFDLFLPLCSLLPFVRFLQAFSQMRLPEATAHLASFSARIKEEPYQSYNSSRDGNINYTWVSNTALDAAKSVLLTCPSAYEKMCLLRLLQTADFGDGGATNVFFRREYWKLSVAEPLLSVIDGVCFDNETLNDDSLLIVLMKNGKWEQAGHWAKLMESSDQTGRSLVHHVTEKQAEAFVAEYKEFLWDIAEERSALWGHIHGLFVHNSLPALQAGNFFLRHAQALEKEITTREVHEILILSLQWLSGMMNQSSLVYPLHLLREMESRIWLLALESESAATPFQDHVKTPGIIEYTADIIAKMDYHVSTWQKEIQERNLGAREGEYSYAGSSGSGKSSWSKRRGKIFALASPLSSMDNSLQKEADTIESFGTANNRKTPKSFLRQYQVDHVKVDGTFTEWDEQMTTLELETAVRSLLEYGQVAAARQLQLKISASSPPFELLLIDIALRLASMSQPTTGEEIHQVFLDSELESTIESCGLSWGKNIDIIQVLEALTAKCSEGGGRGMCKRIVAVAKASNVLGFSFAEAFKKQPIELLQLLSLKAQDSLEEARLFVQTHPMPSASIAKILAESFLKGLLAAHRGGYMDSQNDEGPAPLLWRFSDFFKWSKLCPSEQEIGHALTRLVMTGQEVPHACEVELLILAHHFYKSSACLDGVDVLVALAAKRVECYVSEGDFACLARLVTGVTNFHALSFIFGILIENGQLELLLQKYSAADPAAVGATGFRMAVLSALKHYDPHDLESSSMVYGHFEMKHEMGAVLEERAGEWEGQWSGQPERNPALLEAARLLLSAAEVYAGVDAGQKAHRACARAALLSLPLRLPDALWTHLSETNARRAMAEQPRFQEALLVAEAYGLNHPGEWAPALWARMPRPDLFGAFLGEFVAALPLPAAMLLELARFYRAEVAARGEQAHFSVWLSPGGLPADWVRQLGRSMRCLLRRTRDLRLRAQLAGVATGFADVVRACNEALDRVPDLAGPLILRKGHGGTYLPLM
ncbi:spatacsin carboxy-terminus protein isoform X2 [Wolffia australiana]